MPTSEEAMITKMLEGFLSDRKDADFARVVKKFLGCSDEDRFQAFLYLLTSGKIFANVILDDGKFTPANALLLPTLAIQMRNLLGQSCLN
jgi:hypothetical protein